MNLSRPSTGHPFTPIRLFAEVPGLKKNLWQQFWSEPFRPFFLLGWLLSLVALGLWPLFFTGLLGRFPGPAHSYLMIQGFFGAFATGFLWTALPRMLEVPGPSRRWVACAAVAIGGGALLHLAGYHPMAHLSFLGLVGLVAAFGIKRLPARRDLPPPSFVLVASGISLGVIGTALVLAGETGWIAGFGYRLGRLFLTEIFLLFLVMGVAAFLAPRFLGKPSRQNLPTSRLPSTEWKKQAGTAGIVGAIILAGAFLQAGGAIRAGALLIAVPLTGYILYQIPVWRRQAGENWMAIGMRVALLCSMAGPWVRVAFPDAKVASTHLLLLGGFGLLTLVVGARVTFGHSGYEHLFRTRLRPFGMVVTLYMASLATRLAGEVFVSAWTILLFISAALLIAAHLTWGIVVLPKLLRPRAEDDAKTNSAHHLTIHAARLISGYGRMPTCAKTEFQVPPAAPAK